VFHVLHGILLWQLLWSYCFVSFFFICVVYKIPWALES
jgi:hypothetical protein